MSELTALTCLRLAPDGLRTQLRFLLGQPLRRAGTFGKLSVAGAMTCAGSTEALTTALLWSSAYGAREETQAVLRELSKGAEPLPFDFIATLPVVSAVHAAQHAPQIKFGVFLPAMDAPETWPRLLQLALCWLDERRCDQVLCGWVEEAQDRAGSPGPVSHWLALMRSGLSKAPLAKMAVCDDGERNSRNGAEFIPALQAWLGRGQCGTETRDKILPLQPWPDVPGLNSPAKVAKFHAGQIQFSAIPPG